MHELRQWGIGAYERMTGRRVMVAFEELQSTQWLSRDELYALQRWKLQALIEYVTQHVPYYQRSFKEAGFEPSDLKRDPDCFRHLPTTDKASVRDHVRDLMTTDPSRRKSMHQHSTSGSTGQPLVFWEDNSFRDYVTADVLRHLTWAGWRFGDCHVYLWGLGQEQSLKQQMRSSLMDWALNRFVQDASVLSEATMHSLVRRIRSHRPKLLFGYASSLYHLAQFVEQENQNDLRLQAVFSSAEVLYPHQRQVIERAFRCRVFNRYGALEAGGLGCECEAHAGMHISVENCLIEVLNGSEPAQPGESGQVVITNLNNYAFPFVRYRLDDIARLGTPRGCPCGRQQPMLEVVEGRVNDLLRTPDGRLVRGFAEAMLQIQGIRQFQIVQQALDLITIQLVTDSSFPRSQLEAIERLCKKVMGATTRVVFEFRDSIPVLGSGKFRYIRSQVQDPSRPTPVPNQDPTGGADD